MTLGERIKRARGLRNLSQAGLAKILGTSPRAVGAWERDENVPRNLAKLEDVLGPIAEEDDPVPEGADEHVTPGFVKMRRVRDSEGKFVFQENRGAGRGWIKRDYRRTSPGPPVLHRTFADALNRLAHGLDLEDRDREALLTWIEDNQIDSIPERVDMLERQDQLRVSQYIDKLINRHAAAHIHEVDDERAVEIGIIEPTEEDRHDEAPEPQ